MKRLLTVPALAGLLATSALASGTKGTWTGKISDEKCGAKVDADCAKKCIDGGQKAVAGHAGHHVKVSGTMANDTITVKKVEMVKDADAGMGDMKH